MHFKILLAIFFIIGNCINGIPLETASDNIGRYFYPRIVGGNNAPEGYSPHMVALLAGEMVTIFACGGSIVTPNLVITAAHCIETFVVPGGLLATFHAVVGATNWFTQGKAVTFKDYHIHPEWDSIHIKNDIGFLALNETLKMSKTLKTVPFNFKWVGGRDPSFVTGWGRLSNWGMSPFHMQILEVDTLTPQQCIDKVKAAAIWWGGSPKVDPSIEICTLHSVGKGLCHGDSGSPLISRKTGSLIGIASWAFTCALGAPDMYARISGFEPYIRDIMKKHP